MSKYTTLERVEHTIETDLVGDLIEAHGKIVNVRRYTRHNNRDTMTLPEILEKLEFIIEQNIKRVEHPTCEVKDKKVRCYKVR